MKADPIMPECESASAPLQFQTNPPERILGVDDARYHCHLSAEVLNEPAASGRFLARMILLRS